MHNTMSKTLIIMRHAKTEPFSDSGTDFTRQLTEQGLQMAGKMGERLVAGGWQPQAVYCSPATRTQQTLQAVSAHWPGTPPVIRQADAIYMASAGDILSLIQELPEELQSVMLVGHNPAFHEVTQILSGNVLAKFSPGTIAILQGEIPVWSEITPASLQLRDLLTPQ